MTPELFFARPQSIAQKQYEALRMYFLENKTAKEVASRFGYTYRGFTTIVAEFRNKLINKNLEDPFFHSASRGRPVTESVQSSDKIIIDLRKKNYSVADIKIVLDSKELQISEKTIYNILSSNGFSKLPRRVKADKQKLDPPLIEAPVSSVLGFEPETFKSGSAGLLCFLPYIQYYGIDTIIQNSLYPGTSTIDRLSSILSFTALKLSNNRRYSADNNWCMDRGLGLFAGLNVLPKAAWFTSYSHRVTGEMNRKFLEQLHRLWIDKGLLSQTSNLDFTTIPYWGDGEHLENNWSGKRGKAMESMLAVLAHDPDSGIIDYGNTNVLQNIQPGCILFQKTQQHPVFFRS